VPKSLKSNKVLGRHGHFIDDNEIWAAVHLGADGAFFRHDHEILDATRRPAWAPLPKI
jgi:hypothetical protein